MPNYKLTKFYIYGNSMYIGEAGKAKAIRDSGEAGKNKKNTNYHPRAISSIRCYCLETLLKTKAEYERKIYRLKMKFDNYKYDEKRRVKSVEYWQKKVDKINGLLEWYHKILKEQKEASHVVKG